MKKEPIVIERVYNAPVERVWQALTESKQMKEWYFDIPEFKPETGFEFQFEGSNEDRVYVHLCKITEVIPQRKLAYSWRYQGYEGNSIVSFELFPEGKMTRLRLTHEGLETFPPVADFARGNFVAGWTEIIGELLRKQVEWETIKKSVSIKADPALVWDILVTPSYNRKWAAAFSEGTYVETDWKKDSPVIWKDKDGDVGARGKVLVCDQPVLLELGYFDDSGQTDGEPGEYRERFIIHTKEDTTTLSVEAGPLPVRYTGMHAPLWEDALSKIKALAE